MLAMFRCILLIDGMLSFQIVSECEDASEFDQISHVVEVLQNGTEIERNPLHTVPNCEVSPHSKINSGGSWIPV